MRIKVIYRKNLKMSEGKLAAQVAHAVKNLCIQARNGGVATTDEIWNCDIRVLMMSDKKFDELIAEKPCYVHYDKGLTEVEAGTETCAAWIENE